MTTRHILREHLMDATQWLPEKQQEVLRDLAVASDPRDVYWALIEALDQLEENRNNEPR